MTPIFELCDRAVDVIGDGDPIAATYIGLDGRGHRWPDLSPAGHAARRDDLAALIAEAEALEPTNDADRLARRVLVADLEDQIARYDSGDHYRDLNSIASTLQALKDVTDFMPKADRDDWSRILVRLETIHWPIQGYIETLGAGAAAGEAVAKRQVRAGIDDARIAAGEESTFARLQTEWAALEIDDDGMRDRLGAAIDHARATYAHLADWLESDYLPRAPEADAVGHERYLIEARKHLGMTIDIDETYAWAWTEIAHIHAEMIEVAARIDAGASLADVVDRLATDPDRGAADVDAFLATMQRVQDRAMQQLAGVHFDVPDQIREIDVRQAPAGGTLSPYYSQPSEDFSRNGAIWYPVGTQTSFPLWEQMSIAYHEGFPGHHLQVGVQLAIGDELSRYHRMAVWQPGSGEGWALYAERLMGELGFHDEPDYELGMLAARMLRACRIVIDMGLHCELPIPADAMFHPGETWTWDLAVEMMTDLCLQRQEVAESEATRYLGWPAQAISYKIGEQVILDLRDELQHRPDFDLKQFHNDVLRVGSVGLDLLKELVRAA